MKSFAKVEKLVKEILQLAGTDGRIKIENEDDYLKIDIENCPDAALLIGYRGETLRSLQHIIKILLFNKDYVQKDTRIIIDVGSYLAKKDQELEDLALGLAKEVVKTGHSETMRPMTSYERRKVHSLLADQEKITTESIGQEPSRRIVIKLK